MTDKHRDGRLVDASTLLDRIASLKSVKHQHRVEMIHDQLVSAIDDICAKRKEGAAGFNKTEITVLKDIVFQVVYILDSANHPPGSFFKRKWLEFKQLTINNQIAAVVGIITLLGFAGTGFWTIGTYAFQRFSSPPAIVQTTTSSAGLLARPGLPDAPSQAQKVVP